MAETVWRRGWNDAARFRHSGAFFWAFEVLGAALFGALVAFFFLPDEPARAEAAVYPSIGLMAGFIASYAAILAYSCAVAPIKQRNEARTKVSQYFERKLAFERVYISEGCLFIYVRNDGETDTFTAEVTEMAGLLRNRWTQPPWRIKWKGLAAEVSQIMHGAEAVLDFGTVLPPTFTPGMPEAQRVRSGSMSVNIAGLDDPGRLYSAKAQTFEEAMQTVFRFEIRLTGSSLKVPVECTLTIRFPSHGESPWAHVNPGSLEAQVEAAILEPSPA